MPQVVYSLTTRSFITNMKSNGRTSAGLTIDDIRTHYPDAQVASTQVAQAALEAAFCEEPVEVDWSIFMEKRDVLPPMGWVRRSYCESFKLSERTFGNVTAIFVRIGKQFFRMRDRETLTHDEVVARCQELVVAPATA